MDSLNETQLLLLSNLIYLERVADHNNKTVNKAIDDLMDDNYKGLMESQNPKKIGTEEWPCKMTKSQWIEILEAIKSDQQIMSLKIRDGVTEEKIIVDANNKEHNIGGMRVACFVDGKSNNATVVFRGTYGPYEWRDNGEGGYLSDTVQQQVALDYIEGLEDYNNITVTGHSKGGNKAQYVAITSDKVDRCVSFDGQGFSQEFHTKYKEKIAANSHKITSISAANDFVNSLLIPVAVNQIYIGTPSEGKDFFHYHCPNIMLKMNKKKDGIIKADMRQTADQSEISKLANKLSVYVNTKVEDPVRKELIDGLITKYFEGEYAEKSSEEQEETLEIFKSIIIEFAEEELTLNEVCDILSQSEIQELAFGLLEEKYGPIAELLAITLLTYIYPPLFADDLLKTGGRDIKKIITVSLQKLEVIANFILNIITQIGIKITQFTDAIGKALSKFAAEAKKAWVKLQVYITGLVNEIINTGKAVETAITNYANKITTVVTNFFTSLTGGVKRFIALFGKDGEIRKNIVNTWDRAMDKATQNVNKIINKTRTQIKKQNQAFKTGINYLINYAKQTIEKLGDKGIPALRNFCQRVVQGLAIYTSTKLNVDLIRLADLQYKMRNLERYFGERIHQILRDANRVTSDVRYSYSEYYVQRQIWELERTCDQIRDSGRKICEALQRKTNSLHYALAHYKQIENMLCADI
ncbi:MAG: DUF2974 domain-containing protein [Clostridia bacterium]|nr:DUF2974 domain-containing protein [Clostridia bacterium]